MKHNLDIVLLAIVGLLGTGQPAPCQATATNSELPAIDAAAPAAFETATFALG